MRQGAGPPLIHMPRCCFAPAGLYAGRVTQSLGTACLADVCDTGQGPGACCCPHEGDHAFFFVRLITHAQVGTYQNHALIHTS